jgi:hypothetical protein
VSAWQAFPSSAEAFDETTDTETKATANTNNNFKKDMFFLQISRHV